MSPKAKVFDQYSVPDAFVGSADEMARIRRIDSPVADLHRQLVRHFQAVNPSSDLVLERISSEELIVHGFSRMAGVASLLVGYVVMGYAVSALI